jgi:hypothetical protein
MKWMTRIVVGIFVAFLILLFTNSASSYSPAPDSFVDTTLNQPNYNTSMLPPVDDVSSSLITSVEDDDSLAKF